MRLVSASCRGLSAQKILIGQSLTPLRTPVLTHRVVMDPSLDQESFVLPHQNGLALARRHPQMDSITFAVHNGLIIKLGSARRRRHKLQERG